MKRQHPLISPIGLLFTMVFLIALGLSIWRTGGAAFSPGELSAKALPGVTLKGYISHIDFENRCSLCHAPLRSTQDNLCMACHTQVEEQVVHHTGVHGKIPPGQICADCHSDHHGKDFDPGLASLNKFDHALTAFSLNWHQVNYDATPMECSACHLTQPHFSTLQDKCVACHAAHDQAFVLQHIQDYGDSCVSCHDGLDRMVGFDHRLTSFPLEGQHASLNCARCHGRKDGKPTSLSLEDFRNLPADCASCHTEPDSHRGVFSQDCATCHGVDAWVPATLNGKPFDHTINTGFSLARHIHDYNDQPFTCKGCHPGDISQFDIQTCIACHSGEFSPDRKQELTDFIQKHTAQFSSACLDCHDGVDRMSNFDHARFFPLQGKHEKAKCTSCHTDQVFAGTPKECYQCHAEPKIHAGVFGLQCQDCHTETAWAPAALRRHTFPLNHGGQGTVPCQTCHEKTYVEYTCYGCHEHRPDEILASHRKENISSEDLPYCTRCHPNGRKED